MRPARPPEFIGDRLLKVTLELRGRAKAVMCIVAHGPTEAQNAEHKNASSTVLDKAVKEAPAHEQLFVLLDTTPRKGRKERKEASVGSKDNKVLGANGRNGLNDNREPLLSFATNYDLAVVNTLFSTPKGGGSIAYFNEGTSYTLKRAGQIRIFYILKRHLNRSVACLKRRGKKNEKTCRLHPYGATWSQTRNVQLWRAARHVCIWLKRVRDAAIVRFFERFLLELEEQLRRADKREFAQNFKSVQLEETKGVESHNIRVE